MTTTHRRTTSTAALLAAALLAVCASLLVAPTSAQAAALTVSGRITTPDGGPIGDLRVQAFTGSLDDLPDAETVPRADGRYSIPVRASRTYRVVIDDFEGRYAPVVSPKLSIGSTSRTWDVALSTGRTITGSLSVADGSSPAGVVATALAVDGQPENPHAPEVAADGTYRITGLAAGRYRVGFSGTDAYREQCYLGVLPSNGRTCRSTGTVVDLTRADVTLRPDTLKQRFGRVVGTVRGPDGKPLAGATVSDLGDPVATTDASGRYVLTVRNDEQLHLAVDEPDARYDGASTTLKAPATNTTRTVDLRLRSAVTLAVKATPGKGSARARVTVTPRIATAVRGGTVSLRFKKPNGKAATKTAALPASGVVTLKAKRIKKGTRTLTLSYSGSAGSAPSTMKVKVKVR